MLIQWSAEKNDDSQMFTLDRLNRLERNKGKICDRWDFFGLVCLRVWGFFYHLPRCTEEKEVKFLREINVFGDEK